MLILMEIALFSYGKEPGSQRPEDGMNSCEDGSPDPSGRADTHPDRSGDPSSRVGLFFSGRIWRAYGSEGAALTELSKPAWIIIFGVIWQALASLELLAEVRIWQI